MSKWTVSELLGQASIISRKLSDEIDKHLAAMDVTECRPTDAAADETSQNAYRRRVTPQSATPESEELRRKVDGLSALADALQKAASEVERLKKSEAALVRELKIEAGQITTQMAQIEQLRSEVERLRLTEAEREAIERGEALLLFVWSQTEMKSRGTPEVQEAKSAAGVLSNLLARLRGGE